MTTGSTNYFLLVYRPDSRELAIEEFGRDGRGAVVAYSEREHEFADEPGVEVVLVAADTIETIRKTHSHYFADADEDGLLSEFTRGLAAAVRDRG